MINLEESKQRNRERNDFIYFPTTLNHLRDHNGFRPGALHILIAPKGGSKSTTFNTWISECVFNRKRVYLRLSEEKGIDRQDELVEVLGRVMDVTGLDTLRVDSELNLNPDQLGAQYFEDLKIRLKTFQAEILFFDNFTTSELSDGSIGLQSKNAKALRDIAIKLNIPVVVAAHTVKGFSANSIATGDHVRGTMTLSNTAPFIYSVNVFFNLPGYPTILATDKARGHGKANKKFYRLKYEEKISMYVEDEKLSMVELANILKATKRA